MNDTAEFSKDTNATRMLTSFLQEINIAIIMKRADLPLAPVQKSFFLLTFAVLIFGGSRPHDFISPHDSAFVICTA